MSKLEAPFVSVLIALFAASGGAGAEQDWRIAIEAGEPGTKPRLSAMGATNRVYTLESSSDLVGWTTLAVTLDGLFPYPDLTPNAGQRFYRAHTSPITFSNDWKNQIVWPEDPF